MDFYNEQHAYTLAQSANAKRDEEEEPDENASWVMLSGDGDVVKLPQEHIFYQVRSRIGLDISVPKTLRASASFSVKSDSGTLYVTNQRVSPGRVGVSRRTGH